MLLKLWMKIKKDFVPIILLASLSFYAWRFLPSSIIGEQGLMYFNSNTITHYMGNMLYLSSTAQVAGVLLSAMLVKLVGVNMSLYMWIQLVAMLSIGILFYFVVKVVTKNRFIAFSAALIYTVSYFGNFDMYLIDYSAHFLERASLNVVLLLLSFLFLHLFFEKEKQKYFIISLVLYFLGVYFSHFSILFTFPFFFYPFFWYLFKKNIIKGFVLGMAYVSISGFFVFISSIGSEPVLQSHGGFLQFILQPQKYRYPEGVLMQFVYWSQYPNIIKSMLSGLSPFYYFNYETAAPLKPIIIIAYSVAGVVIYKFFTNQRVLLLTVFFGTTSIFLFNIYLGRYDPLYSADANRYLYFPTYTLAIFWSLFLWVLFRSKRLALKIICIALLAGYYIANANLLSLHYAHFYSDIKSKKAIYNYIISTRSKLKPNTLVVGPYPDIGAYEMPFFSYELGKGQVRYMSDLLAVSDWPTVASSSADVIQLKFDVACQCVLEEKLK